MYYYRKQSNVEVSERKPNQKVAANRKKSPGSACQGTCREEPLLSQLQDVSDGR